MKIFKQDLKAVAHHLQEEYRTTPPFPHVCIDGLFEDEFLKKVVKSFPPRGKKWHTYDNTFEKKLLNSDIDSMNQILASLFDALNSDLFLNFLEELSGCKNLIADPTLMGGGMHQICRGGKLDIHSDFNYHYKTKNRRALNCILYLNKGWLDEYGSHLELWDATMSECVQKIAPVFNRLVVFNTSDISYHGHPDPLMCPENVTRKSIAAYYYVKPDSPDEFKNSRATKYMKRPQDPYDPATEAERKLRVIPRDKREKK
tara:strand:- start:1791 stop:2564 length:774 start_codon:yes stop_codon:yes gene_type:complete